MKRFFLILGLVMASACVPSVKTVRLYAMTSPHRSIAIIPFVPAPGRPDSGRQAADILAEKLRRLGFLVAASSDVAKALSQQKVSAGPLSAQEIQTVAAALGVQAVMTGAVAKSETESSIEQPVYEERIFMYPDAQGKQQPSVERAMIRPPKIAAKQVYCAKVILADARTGRTLWESGASDHIERVNPREAAAVILDRLARRLSAAFIKNKL